MIQAPKSVPADNFPSPRRRRWVKITLLFFAGFWLLNQANLHWSEQYFYSQDAGRILDQSLALADTGRLITAGNPFFGEYRLGPLANYLAAAPLLLTRDIRAQYWFISLLIFLAVPLFFLTLKSLMPEGWSKWLGTMVFAFAWPLLRAPYPVNKDYLPLFLVLYFFLLIKAVSYRRYANILIWPAIGLAMQLHMSAAWLAPATYLAVMPHRKRSLILQTLAGWLLLGGTQIAWIRQILESDQSALSVAADPVAIDSYLECLVRYFFCVPTVFGLGGGIFGLIALFISRRLLIQFPTHRALLRAASLAGAGGLLVLPALAAVKNTFDPDYLFPLVVFWAVLVVFFFRRLEERAAETGDSRWLFASVAVFFMLSAMTLAGTEYFRCRPSPYTVQLTLTDQQQVARRLTAHLLEHDWRNLRLLELVYDERDGRMQLRSSNPVTYRALCLYLSPEIRPYLEAGRPQATVYVQVLPFSRRQRVSELKPPPVATRFDQFTTERLFVSLYWSDVNDTFFLRPIDDINRDLR